MIPARAQIAHTSHAHQQSAAIRINSSQKEAVYINTNYHGHTLYLYLAAVKFMRMDVCAPC